MSAEPRPSSSDQPNIMTGRLGLSAVIRAPQPYMAMPIMKTVRRPQMSPSLPPISMKAAMISE